MQRLKGAGLVGLTVLAMALLLPLSGVLFYVTAQLTLLTLGLGVAGALALWIALLPASQPM